MNRSTSIRFWNWLYEGSHWQERIAKLAEQKGWKLARINGSHHVYIKEGRIERVVIPVHGNQTLKVGLQRALMKIIPVSEEEL